MRPVRLRLPLEERDRRRLRRGMEVLVSGPVLTARDAAHRRMAERLAKGEPLPFPLRGAALYYVGPTPAPPGHVIGSCGPTTSGRMDRYTPLLLEHGLKVMIGKGERSVEVEKAVRRHRAVYLTAVGGLGALLARCVVASDLVAWPDLGTEAVRRLELRDFPCFVALV